LAGTKQRTSKTGTQPPAGKAARNARPIRARILIVLGIALACLIALFIALVRFMVPVLAAGGVERLNTEISAETVSALNRLIMLITVFATLALYFLYRFIVRLVLDPLEKLTRDIYQITSVKRLELDQYNHYAEIKALSGSINDMVEKLAQSTMSTAVFRSIFNGLDAFLFVSDPETMDILFINNSMKKTYGLDERVIGKKCWEVFERGQNGPCSHCPIPRLTENPGGRVVWEEYDTARGRYYEHTNGLIEWTDHKKAHLQHSTDITSLKEAERDIIAAKEQAEASNAAKTDFLARMSHEMRTPLNAIIGMTAIARRHSADSPPGGAHEAEPALDPEKVAYALPKIHEASVHLLSLITDILDMASIETGRLELANGEFNLAKMIRHVADMMTFRIDEKAHQFSIDIAPEAPETIVADEQRLSQVLTNLLSNAIKFTPRQGAISLTVRQIAGDGGYSALRFEVTDNGPGIAPEQKSRIFTLFEQGEGRLDRHFGGTGMGLTICKSIVELMGGDIRVESEPGMGATFIFEVSVLRGAGDGVVDGAAREGAQTAAAGETDGPDAADSRGAPDSRDTAADPGVSDSPDTAGETPDFTGKTILLAEDIEINREIALALLEDTGVAIDCAEDGAEALRLFTENPQKYDGILMDVHMPGVDGLEATRRIRALDIPHAKNIPIVAMTANVFKEDVDKCLAAGMNDHLGKPIEVEKVLGKLRYWLLERGR
jgi:PAS domain S-box-containing protein